jgi:hypothetical protein
MNMNKNGFIVSMLLAAAMMVAGCNSDNLVSDEAETQAAKNAAAQKILGKWVMKKSVTEEGESTDKYAILEFDADGKTVYNGTLGEGYEDMNEESTYKLGNDWREEGGELSGHVYFKIWGGPYDGNDRFECVFKNDEMYLVRENDPDAISAKPSTVYCFVRSEFTEDTKDVSVLFQLQNEKGEETYTFKEGENIVFRLEIKNYGTKTTILPPKSAVIGRDIFRVYSASDKKDLGTPWNQKGETYTTMEGHFLLSPNSPLVYVCPWLNKSGTTLSPDLYSNFKIDGTKPLAAGDYYSEFDIKLSDTHIVTCKCNFKIK